MAPSTTPLSTHYALVVDAGSSGSRLQIYSWRDPDLERAEILNEVSAAQHSANGGKGRWWWGGRDGYRGKGKGKGKEHEMEEKALRRLVRVGKGVEGDEWVKRVEPGISTVAPEDIPGYLAPLLSHALQHIPPSVHSTTPIYLLATAGMRLLPPERRDAVLKATCELLRDDYPFLVEGPSDAGPCGESVRVISGEEEGMWGWVAVNYLMDGPPPDSSADSVTPVDVNHHSPTFGFLDMGGASTQLAFSPSAGELSRSGFPAEDLRTVSLRLLSGETVEWPVFVASWLGFGTNRARERYTQSLVDHWEKSHPSPSSSDLSSPIPDPCLPLHLQVPSKSSHPDFIGTGSFSECLTALTPLLEHSAPCPTEHCLFAGQPTPHIDFQREDQRGFIGISEYWYTTQHILGVGGVWDWGSWEKGMNAFCQKDWAEMTSGEGEWAEASLDPTRLEMQCFKGAWISNVLHEGIGIPRLVDAGGNDTLTGGELGDTNAEAERRAREKGLLEAKGKHHFQSMDEVGETAISWTLGKMVIEASKAVQPRSSAMESAWMERLEYLRLPGALEDKLEDFGIQVVWAYAFIAFVLIGCMFSRRKTPTSASNRRRKPSISSPYSPPATWRTWLGGWSTGRDDTISLEDGGLADTSASGKSRFATPGRLRLWSLRLTNIINKYLPFSRPDRRPTGLGLGGMGGILPRARHNSMPLIPLAGGGAGSTSAHLSPTSGGNYSQPGSPRAQYSSFFTPASPHYPSGTLSPAVPRAGSITPDASHHTGISSATSVSPAPPSIPSSPPPRSSFKASRPIKPRQNSHNFMGGNGGEGMGWNDPPVGMLGAVGGSLETGGAVLTPMVAGALSRNSSRVNLSELGLAQRSMSRTGTPGFDDSHA
ncbi:hypothetical protein IAT38_003204 [Cryptococcus sp. DSM 104549]